jgi:hypothetical protein
MNQKVKLQVTSDVVDVPRLSGVILTEALIDVSKLQAVLEQTSGHLKHVDITNPSEVDKLLKALESMEVARILLMKIDSRLGDTASVVGGLHDVLTKPPEEIKQEQKVEKDDSVSSR